MRWSALALWAALVAALLHGLASGVEAQTQDEFDRVEITSTDTDALTVAGGVGIGTASPTSDLHIYRDDTNVAALVTIEQDGTGDAMTTYLLSGVQGWSVGVDNTDAAFKIGTDSGDVGASPRLTILNGGNVGIGTPTPAFALAIERTGSAADINVESEDDNVNLYLDSGGADKDSRIFFRDDSVSLWQFFMDTSIDHFRFNDSANAYDYLTFDRSPVAIRVNDNGQDMDFIIEASGVTDAFVVQGSSGNVGIGTASPSEKLHIVGNMLLNAEGNTILFQTSGTPQGRIFTGDSVTTNSFHVSSGTNIFINIDGIDNSTGRYFAVGKDSYDGTGSYAELFRIQENGNVGIGTASPAFTSGDGLEVERSSVATVRVERTSATASAGEFSATDGLVSIGATASVPLRFITNNAEVARFDSSGNFGVGDTTPDALFDVAGDAIIDNELTVGAGTAGDPSVNFVGALKTGMYLDSTIGDDTIGFSLTDTRILFITKAGANPFLVMAEGAWGTGTVGGSVLKTGANTSGSGAAGVLQLARLDNVIKSIWVDAADIVRVSGAPPLEDGSVSDTSGVIIGVQTSSLDAKNVSGEFTAYDHGLQAILEAPLFTYTYKSGAYGGEEFVGIITDYSPIFGMDSDRAHPGGRSLNSATSFGMTFAAIREIDRRLALLEDQRPGGGRR